MTAITLILALALTLVAASLYVTVGTRYAARARQQGEGAVARFALFWLGLAAWGTLESGWSFWVALSPPSLAVSVVILHLKVATAVVAFYGLVSYLVSLYTASPRARRLVDVAYLGIFLFADAYYWWRHPIGQTVGTWNAQLVYLRASPLLYQVLVLLLFGPPLASAIAYAARFRHAVDDAQRARILSVSAFFAVFFGGVLLGWLSSWPWWGLMERMLALATVAGVYMAIDPSPDGRGRAGEIAPV